LSEVRHGNAEFEPEFSRFDNESDALVTPLVTSRGVVVRYDIFPHNRLVYQFS